MDQSSEPSFLNTIRAKWITNAPHGLRVSASARVLPKFHRLERIMRIKQTKKNSHQMKNGYLNVMPKIKRK